MINQTQPSGTMVSGYDIAGRRTSLAWPDAFTVNYDYDNVGEMAHITESTGTTLATYSYNDLGQRITRQLPNVTNTGYAYDPTTSWLTSLSFNGGSWINTATLGGYNPAGEIGTRTNSEDQYAWTAGVSGTSSYTANGLNQYATAPGGTISHDARGNITAVGGVSYTYNENNLMTAAGSTTFAYDPLDRLYQLSNSSANRHWLYDGDHIATELDNSNVIQARYVFGPGDDEPVVFYAGSGTTSRYFIEQDERGSVTRVTNAASGIYSINAYDEYGNISASGVGAGGIRFAYTGQLALFGTSGLLYYKARIYNPAIGRFMQTDPIGYANGPNWYNYVGSNPINYFDPSGLDDIVVTAPSPIVVTAPPPPPPPNLVTITGATPVPSGGGPDDPVLTVNGIDCSKHPSDPRCSNPNSGLLPPGSITSPQNRRRVPCEGLNATQLANSGKVAFQINSSSGGFGVYAGLAGGNFTTESGISGQFRSVEIGGGVGAGIGLGVVGVSRSLATFTGANYNLSLGVGPVGGSLAFDTNDFSRVGGSGGLGTGSPFKPGISAAATYSETQIYNVTCPGY